VRQALQEALPAAIDAGEILLSRTETPPPATYRNVFDIPRDHRGLPPDLADAMGAAAGLRNVLVHLCTGLDFRRIHAAHTMERSVLERFAAWVTGPAVGSQVAGVGVGLPADRPGASVRSPTIGAGATRVNDGPVAVRARRESEEETSAGAPGAQLHRLADG
jgi:hypothetical protein